MTSTRAERYCQRCSGRLASDNVGTICASCARQGRGTPFSPPELPEQFWRTDQMRDALATWHMGRVFYAYRTHPHHGRALSQEQMGNWLGLTQAQLSRIENGRAPEELTKLIRYAQILGIPNDQLWFAVPEADGSKPTFEERGSALMLAVVLHGRSVRVPIDRAAAKAHGLDALIAELDGTAPAIGQQVLGHALPADDGPELKHVAAALDDAHRYLDGTVVDYFRLQLGKSKADDGTLGAARALPLVLVILGAIAQHIREVKPDVRTSLLSLGADGAEFAGWLYRDLHDHASAAYWYDRAMEWAQAANDTAMQGYVLLKKSQMAYDERDPTRVAILAEAAQAGPWQLPVPVRAEVTQQQALGLAMIGEPLAAVETKMETARSLLDGHAPEDERDKTFSSYFTADTLRLRCAACYTEAGKPALAARLFAEALKSTALSRRDAGFFRARRATALALSGEPDEAAKIGLEALTIARETNSERTVSVLADTAQTLAPWSGRPAPRELRAALAASA